MNIITPERLIWLWIIGAILNFTGTIGTLIGIAINLTIIVGWLILGYREWTAQNDPLDLDAELAND